MICPKCKTEIKEGFLYCQNCGEEIIMVAGFEENEKVEDTLSKVTEIMADEVLSTMSDSVSLSETANEQYNNDLSNDSDSELNNDKPFFYSTKFLITAIVVICLFFSFGIYKVIDVVSDYYSYDIQYAKAEDLFTKNDYENCIMQLKHVISIDGNSEKPRLLLADSYFASEKYDEAIAVLNSMPDEFKTDSAVYERLIANYEAEGDISAIIELSKTCSNHNMSSMFKEYISDEPEFSIDEGTLFEFDSLELIGSGNGDIYYTIDGTEPSLSSNKYKAPIKLDEGTTEVKAIYVNEKGIASKVVSNVYNVEIIKPTKPKLLTASGKYSVPRLIKLDAVEKGTLYYTRDGSNPTANSKKFVGPVAMPLGKSEFRFVCIDEKGVESEIVTANYDLKIESAIDTETAQAAVSVNLMTLGIDVSNHQFVSQYGYSVEARNYYLIEDYLIVDGKQKKQPDMYAVDTQSGTVFKAISDLGTGEYNLTTMY